MLSVSGMHANAVVIYGIFLICSTSTKALLNPSSSWIDSINQKLNTFQARLDQCEKQIGMLNTTINSRLGSGTVAFTAFLKNDLDNIQNHQVIVFEDILTNIGNAYDNIDGHFQAPVTGTYMFVVTLTSLINKEALLGLVKDGRHLAYALASSKDPGEYETSTMATVVSMSAGERIWVQNSMENGSLDGKHWSQFSGHLIA